MGWGGGGGEASAKREAQRLRFLTCSAGGVAYARDKITSARLYAINARGAYARGGLMREGGLCARGDVFAGHYGMCKVLEISYLDRTNA